MKLDFSALREAGAFAILDRPEADRRFRTRMVRTWKDRRDFYLALAVQLEKHRLSIGDVRCVL